MTNHPIAEQDSLEARLRRTEKRKSYLAMNATAPIIEGEYDALINPDGPEAADTLSQMRDALAIADDAISGALDDMRDVDLSVTQATKNALVAAWSLFSTLRPDAALTTTKIEKGAQ